MNSILYVNVFAFLSFLWQIEFKGRFEIVVGADSVCVWVCEVEKDRAVKKEGRQFCCPNPFHPRLKGS